jgi:hypothetical protein
MNAKQRQKLLARDRGEGHGALKVKKRKSDYQQLAEEIMRPALERKAQRDGVNGKHPAFKPSQRDAALVNAWREGATIKDLVVQHGLKRSAIRRIITVGVGGREAFRQLREGGAGGKAASPIGRKGAAPPSVSDDGVRRVSSSRWRSRNHREPRVVDLKAIPNLNIGAYRGPVMARICTVFIAPSGREYVHAQPNEKADLIVVTPKARRTPGIRHVFRMKLFSKSRFARKAAEEDALAERGAAALERIRDRKRAAKLARKERKTRVATKAEAHPDQRPAGERDARPADAPARPRRRRRSVAAGRAGDGSRQQRSARRPAAQPPAHPRRER